MTDAKLAELATKFKQLKAEEDEAQAARKLVGDKLVAEMERRGTRGILTGGWKVTLVSPETIVYDEARLKRKLGTKFRSITSLVVDKNKIGAAVQEGLVSMRAIEQCSTVVAKASYVLVNPE